MEEDVPPIKKGKMTKVKGEVTGKNVMTMSYFLKS